MDQKELRPILVEFEMFRMKREKEIARSI
jgi:hypothetical protein